MSTKKGRRWPPPDPAQVDCVLNHPLDCYCQRKPPARVNATAFGDCDGSAPVYESAGVSDVFTLLRTADVEKRLTESEGE